MKKIVIALISICFICSLALAREVSIDKYPLTSRDRTVMLHVFDALRATDTFVFNGPSFVEPETNSITMQLGGKNNDWQINEITYDGKNVKDKCQIKTKREKWLWGDKTIRVSYNPGAKMPDGVHALVITGSNGLKAKIAAVTLMVATNTPQPKKIKEPSLSTPGVREIFARLSATQQKVNNLTANFTNRLEIGRGISCSQQVYQGGLAIQGQKDFRVTLTSSPQIKSGEWRDQDHYKRFGDRNILAPFSLVFYLDYANLWENYEWQIVKQENDIITLYGWSGWLSSRPSLMRIEVNSAYWVPQTVDAFLTGTTPLSRAMTTYGDLNGASVQVAQYTIIHNGNSRQDLQALFELSNIEVNRYSQKTKPGNI